MTSTDLKSSDFYLSSIANSFNDFYISWANNNCDKYPQLFTDRENAILCPAHQLASRFSFAIVTHSVLEAWSFTGSIATGLNVTSKSARSAKVTADIVKNIVGTSFFKPELIRHCYGSTRMLMYQAASKNIADVISESESGSATKKKPALVPEADFMNAMISIFSNDLEDEAFWLDLIKQYGLETLPSEEAYIPIQHRRTVFKRLLSSLFKQLETYEHADTAFRLIADNHKLIIDETVMSAVGHLIDVSHDDYNNPIIKYYNEHHNGG